MTIRAVILDIYGTILEVGPPPPDAEGRWQQLFRATFGREPHLSRLAFAIAANRAIARYHEIACARGIRWPEISWSAVATEVVPELSGLSRADREEFLFRQVQTGHATRVTPEAATTLRWFKQNSYRLGLASNAQAYTIRELAEGLAPHGLDLQLFEPAFCFSSHDYGFSKPDPHVFQVLTARLAAQEISPAQTLMVGDRYENDIAPARNHGWQTWQLGPQGDGTWAQLRDRLQSST